MPIAALLAALFGAMGSIASGGFQAAASNKATKTAAGSKQAELDWQREAAGMEREAQEEENRRRQIEASFRAAKLEDVIKMFQNLEGLGGLGQDADQMRDLAGQLMGDTGVDLNEADLRKSAMRELGRNSESLNAMMAQAGVRGSGFAAGQQRGLMGDTMMGLSRDIAQNQLQLGQLRQQGLMGAGSLFGQAGGLNQMMQGFEMDRLGNIARLFQDDAFGPNAPDIGNMFGGYSGEGSWNSPHRRGKKRGPVI